jgi:hypothetical protein
VAEILLRPRFYEAGPFREQYDRLVIDLESQGFSVEIEREVEERGTAGEILQTAYDVAVHLADEAGIALVDLVVLALVTRLRGKAILGKNRGRARKAFIYGPGGEVLREVELPEDKAPPP